jgi:hypothetical protein
VDILKLFKQLLSWALGFLPDSPFHALDVSPVAPYLSAINWIVPVDFIISTLELWLVAIAAYYVISAALRWARAIS